MKQYKGIVILKKLLNTTMIKKILKKALPSTYILKLINLRNNYMDGFVLKSYSQEGEDMILRRIFENVKDGFYVDVGAHHPKRFSNTYYFYKRGWSGINIDAMPGSMTAFNNTRPRDINIELPVSDKKEILTYYAFNEPALNGFSKKLSEERNGKDDYFIKYTKDIETTTLDKIFERYLPSDIDISFISIDVEGLDFKVLKSNDFTKYRPKVILIEVLDSTLESMMNNEITKYLHEFKYCVYAKAVNTVIFVDMDFLKDQTK